MWQQDVVWAMPWAVICCCSQTSWTTAWRHEGTLLAEAGSGGKQEWRTFIPTKTGSCLLPCCIYTAWWAPWWPGLEHLGPSFQKCPCESAGCQSMALLFHWQPSALEKLAAVTGYVDGLCRWAAAHLSVTMVTLLPVLSSARTSCPLMIIMVVGLANQSCCVPTSLPPPTPHPHPPMVSMKRIFK